MAGVWVADNIDIVIDVWHTDSSTSVDCDGIFL